MNYTEISSPADIPAGARVLIYGCGGRGRELLGAIREKRPDVDVDGFLDSARDADEVDGLPVRNVASATPEHLGGPLVVTASTYHKEMLARLEALGHRSVLVYMPFDTAYYEATYRLMVTAAERSGEKLAVVRAPEDLPRGASFAALHLPGGDEDSRAAFLELVGRICAAGRSECRATLEWDEAAPPQELLRRSGLGQADFLLCCDTGAPAQRLDAAMQLLRERLPDLPVRYWRRPEPFECHALAVQEKRVLFIPIPKCGCTSMALHLRQRFEPGFEPGMPAHRPNHSGNIFVRYRAGDPAYDDYFKFSIARNPYERLGSLYHSHRILPDYANAYVLRYMRDLPRWSGLSFADFCAMACACPDELAEHHFKSQNHFLGGRPDALNAVFHLENLHEQAGPLLESLDVGLPRKMANVSNRSGIPYLQEYYSDTNLKAMVRRRYAEDFERLGYA